MCTGLSHVGLLDSMHRSSCTNPSCDQDWLLISSNFSAALFTSNICQQSPEETSNARSAKLVAECRATNRRFEDDVQAASNMTWFANVKLRWLPMAGDVHVRDGKAGQPRLG